MAQTPATYDRDGDSIRYTPGSAVTAGDVVVVGTIPMIAKHDIAASANGVLACEGIFDVPKTTDTFSAGDAVYWDVDGDPVGGTAGSGAADSSSGTGNLMGLAEQAAATDAEYVKVKLTAVKRTATVAGSITADDISGGDSSLAIAGLASTTGGAVAVAGGTSSTGGVAGGAVSATGGTGGAAGAGGAVSVVGGVPASGNGAGGAGTFSGGAGSGTGAGGAVTTKGGASGTGATGNGGAWTSGGGAALSTNGTGGAASLTGGVATGTGTGGAVTITSGASAGASGTAGAVAIDCGAAAGGTAGAITIGGTNAASITLGKMPVVPSATVAATGSDQSGAAAIATGITLVSAADATKGVKLPAAAAGLICIVKNRDSENAILKVYPNTSDVINALSADAAISMAAKTSAIFVAYDATTWYTIPLLPS